MSFNLSKKQMDKAIKFVDEKSKELLQHQKNTITPEDPFYDVCVMSWEMNAPYLGASGGATTYSFTPTSLGVVCHVTWLKGSDLEQSLDISEYDTW